MRPTPPPLTRQHALFLDLDGTLIDFAPAPDEVVVPEGLAAMLGSVAEGLGGALAIVTGRPLADVDRLFAPWTPVGAGLHGLEMRWPGTRTILRDPTDALGAVRRGLQQRFEADPRIWVEDKTAAVALHFRRAPERGEECKAAMAELVQGSPELRLLHGHCVIEALPLEANKGRAILRLMDRAPFAGRIPSFVGDDVTDEDAFPAVDVLGGLSVKVGQGDTRAEHRLDGPHDVRRWLRESLRSLQSRHGDERSKP